MEIKISKCATQCYHCEQEFSHEQKVRSVASIEEESLDRRDYCLPCSPEDPDGALVFCAWETQYNDPRVMDAEQQETFSPLRRLFYELAESTERIDLAQAFLAAQLLKRQKAFRQVRESEEADGAVRVTLFLDRAGNRLIETRDLQFTYGELDTARVQLLDRLRALEAPEPEPEPVSDTESDALAASKDELIIESPEASDSGNGENGHESTSAP